MNFKSVLFRLHPFISLLSLALQCPGQTTEVNTLDNVAEKLIRSLRSNIEESIFIHTDKSVYTAGDKVWFNVFLVNKVSHKLSHQSKIVFVDLVDDSDSMISRLLLDRRSLRLDGVFELPAGLRDGSYWVRAYTNNILRTDSSDICVHPLYVVNTQNAAGNGFKNSFTNIVNPFLSHAPRLEIFPEGGSLIAGANAMVAFKIVDANNNPLEVDGWVKDNRDTIVRRFQTSFPGFGKFAMFPWATRQYTAYIRTRNNQVFSYPLPATASAGASLSIVKEDENSLRVRVSLGDSLYDKRTVTYLVGVSRDSLCFAGIGERMYETDIPKKAFPGGEATFLLFDDHDKLLSERSVYIDRNAVVVDVKADKENYASRENAGLTIAVNDVAGQPLLSLITVSVTDDSTVKYFYDDDLDAVIKKPYSAAQRDLIMLAQRNKYRKWSLVDSITASRETAIEDHFFDVHGTVMTQKIAPLPDAVVTLFSARSGFFTTDTSDKDGHFSFPFPGHVDTLQMMLQVADKKGKQLDATILVDSCTLPVFNTPAYLKKALPASAIREIVGRRLQQDFILPARGKELKEVIVRARIKQAVTYDESKRVSRFSRIITPEMLERASLGTMGNVLFMIPGVHMRNGQLMVDAGGDAEPLLIVDGVAVNPAANSTMQVPGSDGSFSQQQIVSIEGSSPLMNYLNSLSPRYIDFIEVLNGPEAAEYGVRAANGVIVIHTRAQTRDLIAGRQNPLKKLKPAGFSVSPHFAGPDYSRKELKKSKSPDQRSTIFWSGPLITDDNGKTTIHFYTADAATTYTVTVKGITASGEIFVKRVLLNRK